MRISASDWVGAEGVTPEDAVAIARMLQEAGVDIIDVSAGQTSQAARPVYGRMFQTPFSDRIRNETGIATMAVGNIYEPDHVNSILMAGRADLCCLARPHLADPYWTLHAAAQLGYRGRDLAQALSGGARSAAPAGGARRAGRRSGCDGGCSQASTRSSPAAAAVSVPPSRARYAGGRGRLHRRPARRTARRGRGAASARRAIVADVTSEADCAAMMAAARAAHGPIDILIANAGAAESAPAARSTCRTGSA